MPNGRWRSKAEAGKLKAEGVRAGVPDLCIIRNGLPYFIEIKKKGGKLSQAQEDAIYALREAGAMVYVCFGVGECLEVLEMIGAIFGAKEGSRADGAEAN